MIIAAAGKMGHQRQAIAIAERLALSYSVCVAQEFQSSVTIAQEIALVLAAGRQSLAPARAIARHRRTGKPLVVALQPVLWRPHDFDLVWAPSHDRRRIDALLPPRLETLTAPSAVDARARAAGAAHIAPCVPTRPGGTVGVLVGGSSAHAPFTVADAERLGAALAAFCLRHDCALLVSTSPRTGAGQAETLRRALAGLPHLFVDGTATDASLSYAGIIATADSFIVTSDSVAMLSDAATTGRGIYGWRIGRGKARFERFYNSLMAYGAMRWFDGELHRWSYEPLDATGVIAQALHQRLGLPNVAAQHK